MLENLPCAGAGHTSLTPYLAVEDAYARTMAAGARAMIPVRRMFSGDRHGLLVCPFGHRWIIATQVEHVSDDEIVARWAQTQSALPVPEENPRQIAGSGSSR